MEIFFFSLLTPPPLIIARHPLHGFFSRRRSSSQRQLSQTLFSKSGTSYCCSSGGLLASPLSAHVQQDMNLHMGKGSRNSRAAATCAELGKSPKIPAILIYFSGLVHLDLVPSEEKEKGSTILAFFCKIKKSLSNNSQSILPIF